MATPMTADQQLAAFKKFGLTTAEHLAWKTHNRNGHGGWGDVHGIVVHHTGSEISAASMEAYVYNGDAGRALPGPLCHWTIRRDGTVVMIGNGRANHAGSGSETTYQHVINEDYTGDLHPGSDNFDGNAVYYGFETQYDGSHAPVAAQYKAMVAVAAAVCDFHGWSAKSIIGHKEHTSRKDDPGHVDMSDFRADVQALLDGDKPAPKPTPKPVPKPTPAPKLVKFPGASHFVLGKSDPNVTKLGKWLIAAGFNKHFEGKSYTAGPTFTKYDKANLADFQKSVKALAGDADGIPGPLTWELLQTAAAK